MSSKNVKVSYLKSNHLFSSSILIMVPVFSGFAKFKQTLLFQLCVSCCVCFNLYFFNPPISFAICYTDASLV
ncbi:hypothetical protein EUGRSUZ_G01080 [Eucalyptus grandis]|uniref:Uncharacterized protein n=2 Tax=Eucalyptus grandis TaxID=71139 RepID=A0A059BBH9_EUCGR|nr:hypothetical protein EUGRSUZ_G01080 [Eucalyptus grandis]